MRIVRPRAVVLTVLSAILLGAGCAATPTTSWQPGPTSAAASGSTSPAASPAASPSGGSGTSDTTQEMWREVQAYLAQHVAVLGADGRAWSLGLRDEDVAAADGDHPAIMVVLTFTPPVGGSARAATLRYDAVTHRVASHYVLVYRQVDGERIPLGRLQSPATDLPLPD